MLITTMSGSMSDTRNGSVDATDPCFISDFSPVLDVSPKINFGRNTIDS